MKNRICWYLLLLFLTSCNKYSTSVEKALVESGSNKKELEKVVNYYKANSADSLKYYSAIFLIENITNHFSYKPLIGYEEIFDSISKYPMNDYRKAVFRKILDSVSNKILLKKPELILDSKNLTSKFLIDNIEFSFLAWNKVPENKRASFEEFCDYILPYKNSNEAIDINARKNLAKKYSWVTEELKNGKTLKSVVDSVSSQFDFEIIKEIRDYYPQTLSISQLEKTRFGLCDDGVNYFVNVFRALGIISARDMTPHWGNHPALGHSWLYVKYGNEEYSTDVRGKIDLKKEYIKESIPKVFRRLYSNKEVFGISSNLKDVTNEYVPTTNIVIKNFSDTPKTTPILCVFDVKERWKAISLGKYQGDKIKYFNMGVNVLYMPISIEDKNIISVNYPFFIDGNKKIHFFNPQKPVLNAVSLIRKIGISSPRNRRVIDWIKNLNQGVFQVANKEDFSDAHTIHQISNFNSTHIKTIKFNINKKFRFVRFYSNKKESYLAKLAFYDIDNKLLSGDVIKKNNRDFKWENGAYDEDQLSFSGGKNFYLGLKFSEPKIIGKVEFQVRNDGNHINIGERYELFYWNQDWKSLGTKIANDTVLYYNVPSNSLMWLKNHSNGNEEHVFFVDKNKKQRWLGFDNY